MAEEQPAGEQEKRESAAPKDIGAEIELFINQIDALAETLPLATLAIQGVRTASRQELTKFLNEECEVISTDGAKKSYRFGGGQALKFARLIRRVEKAQQAQLLVPRGLFVALVSQFDAFVGGLIRQLFKLKPELVNSSGRNLTFSQLAEFGSIEAAREFVIDKEIESVLRDSHADQFDWLEGKFNLPLRKDLPAWPSFIEATERRNLFVHTNGVVSRQYLEVCRKHACQLPENICLGQSLRLTREYLNAAYECFLEIGVKLGQVLLRKIQPDEIKKADMNLVSVTYNLIAEERYQLARILLDFATETLKVHASEEYRLTLVVNRAQTYKWTGDEEKCKDVLIREDWTATNLKFRLAYAVLRDDFEQATGIVKQIGKDDPEVDRHAYREWPLLKGLRKSPEFNRLFEQIFGEPLYRVIVQDTQAGGSDPERVN